MSKLSKKILITGAGGYIGSVATDLFLENGFDVVAVDNLSHGHRQPFKVLAKKYGADRLKFYKQDIKNIRGVLEKEPGIEAVVHYGAFCSVNESVEKPEIYFENNCFQTLELLKALVDFKIKNLIFSSSCAVYGEAEYLPVDEDHSTNPANPYGLSKRIVEEMINWFGKSYGLNFVILRYFNVCGANADGTIGDSKKPSVHLVQNLVRASLGIENFYLTFAKVDTPDTSPIRDYVDVVDLNTAHLKAIEYLLAGGQSQIINLGTGFGSSVLEIVNKVESATGHKFDLKKSEPRKGEYATMVASNKKAGEILGWKPQRNIDDSIKSLMTWYKNYPLGWKS